ncbi:MAG: hypothetical protein ACTSQ4_12270, partial [Candidatus Heimdallarchaeaceae archaeon]
MRYIKSSWSGFEVDSSEFSVSITVYDFLETVKAFIESPFIERTGVNFQLSKRLLDVIPTLKKDLEEDNFKDMTEEYPLLESITEGGKVTDDNLVEFCYMIDELAQKYPKVKSAFRDCSLSFRRKNLVYDVTDTYEIRFFGGTSSYSQPWYTPYEWDAVLESINKRTKI